MASADDRRAVADLLGRLPRAKFDVVVRTPDGSPVVIRNAPLLDDGTPMPTRFYLVDRDLNRRIGTLEAAGGVREAERAVGLDTIAEVHRRYAEERDAALPDDWNGPRPFGGVGGTRRGLKCLHAHYAHHLAGGVDPVGEWVQDRLDRADAPAADPPPNTAMPDPDAPAPAPALTDETGPARR